MKYCERRPTPPLVPFWYNPHSLVAVPINSPCALALSASLRYLFPDANYCSFRTYICADSKGLKTEQNQHLRKSRGGPRGAYQDSLDIRKRHGVKQSVFLPRIRCRERRASCLIHPYLLLISWPAQLVCCRDLAHWFFGRVHLAISWSERSLSHRCLLWLWAPCTWES